MKKILIGIIATIAIGMSYLTVTDFFIGPKRGDPAKGIVKSPPPVKKKSKEGCSGESIIRITKSTNPNDVGKELFIEDSDVDVCGEDIVCVMITGPSHNRKVKIKSHCRPGHCNCP